MVPQPMELMNHDETMAETVVGRRLNCKCYWALTFADDGEQAVLRDVFGSPVDYIVFRLNLGEDSTRNNHHTQCLSYRSSPYP